MKITKTQKRYIATFILVVLAVAGTRMLRQSSEDLGYEISPACEVSDCSEKPKEVVEPEGQGSIQRQAKLEHVDERDKGLQATAQFPDNELIEPLSQDELTNITDNVARIGSEVGLSTVIFSNIESVAREKAKTDKSYLSAVNSLMRKSRDLILDAGNRNLTIEEHQALEGIESQLKKMDELRIAANIEYEDKIRNLLSPQEIIKLEGYERNIIKIKGVASADSFLNAVKGSVGELSADQLAEMRNIIPAVENQEIDEENPLGFSFQRHDQYSQSFEVDVSGHIIAAAEQFYEYLNYEQRNNFHLEKLKESLRRGDG